MVPQPLYCGCSIFLCMSQDNGSSDDDEELVDVGEHSFGKSYKRDKDD